jgi:hypothetical protein
MMRVDVPGGAPSERQEGAASRDQTVISPRSHRHLGLRRSRRVDRARSDARRLQPRWRAGAQVVSSPGPPSDACGRSVEGSAPGSTVARGGPRRQTAPRALPDETPGVVEPSTLRSTTVPPLGRHVATRPTSPHGRPAGHWPARRGLRASSGRSKFGQPQWRGWGAGNSAFPERPAASREHLGSPG